MGTIPQSDLSTEWPDLDMPMHKYNLLCPIDAHSLILKFRSKMADWWEMWDFPILNIWESFRSLISVLNDLTCTCPCMNIGLCVPFTHIYSFWILADWRSHPLVLWRCNMSCMLMRIYVVPYWCTFSYLDPMIQDGQLAGNLVFSYLT